MEHTFTATAETALGARADTTGPTFAQIKNRTDEAVGLTYDLVRRLEHVLAVSMPLPDMKASADASTVQPSPPENFHGAEMFQLSELHKNLGRISNQVSRLEEYFGGRG